MSCPYRGHLHLDQKYQGNLMYSHLYVVKRTNQTEKFDFDKLTDSIFSAASSVGGTNRQTSEELAHLVVESLKKDAPRKKRFSTLEIGDAIEKVLVEQGHAQTTKAYILFRATKRQQLKSQDQLGVKDDIGLGYNSLLILKNKYLQKDDDGRLIETPKQLFERIAQAVAWAEKRTERNYWESEFFDLLSSLDFIPGGRTLANAGTFNGQLANCFVLPFEDSVEEIFQVVKESSILKRNGGGVGFSMARIRPKGDRIGGTSGRACGPVALMKILNSASEILMQDGGRRSGNMVVLPVSHPDIFEFIMCKEDDNALNQINFSIGLTSKFMEAVIADRKWELINPRTGRVVNEVKARSIFELAAHMAWKNGDPGIVFLDRLNQDNPTPHIGPIEAVNLCGEQPLLPYEACNLGSLNLVNMLQTNGQSSQAVFDYEKLKEVVAISVRFLDDVIDVCKYPLVEVEQIVKANRKIGLGVMGWADVLLAMGLSYDSKEARDLARQVMGTIRDTAYQVSRDLAKEKGSFPNFKGSKWEQKGYKQMRNATLTTIAPTGSISMLAGVSYGIEPVFALAFYKEALGGVRLPEVNPYLEKYLKAEGLLKNGLMDEISQSGTIQHMEQIPRRIRDIFKTAHDLDYRAHLEMQAAFQEFTDNAVSKTINLPHDASVSDVESAYKLAWRLGCKGMTIYRDGSRDVQV
ncbi:MAG TPA: adenosylcobalamin-dependent ribonucleoside-diphosphate reductase, partial [Candidatus Wirthbacteria bacterium]|nr:adenosylcobalamin-dependent ribonucleoside-diphosphate reductase [Candidatus Wirthbacteria bacterium]